MAKLTTGRTNFGGGFVFSQGAGGLWDVFDHIQAGKLYLTQRGDSVASGTFDKAFTSAPNHVSITMRVPPSGNEGYITSLTTTGFTYTFPTAPIDPDENLGLFPIHVADWFVVL